MNKQKFVTNTTEKQLSNRQNSPRDSRRRAIISYNIVTDITNHMIYYTILAYSMTHTV